jgi:hypothetical protein
MQNCVNCWFVVLVCVWLRYGSNDSNMCAYSNFIWMVFL